MQILELELKDFKRFSLTGTKRIVYTPSKRINIIIGRGGCGKSSLLRELSPLPANIKKDYNEGGYKRITIRHNDIIYILSSGLNGSTRHSFLCNDEELNDGGTKRVQMRLVEEHFNITQPIQNMLVGKTDFATMVPASRKDWIMSTSNIDYDYVMSVYTAVKSAHRDVVGALKISQRELINNNEKLIKEEEKRSITETVKYLNDVVDRLFELKSSTSPLHRSSLDDIDTLVPKLKTLLKKLKQPRYKSVNAFNKRAIEINHQIKHNDTQYLKVKEDIKVLKNTESNLKIGDVKDIERELKNVNKEINAIISDIYVNVDVNAIDDISSSFDNIMVTLSTYLIELESMTDVELGKEMLETLKRETISLKQQLTLSTREFDKYAIDLKLLEKKKNDDETECPSCGHKWVKGYDERTHTIVEDRLDKLGEKIERFKSTINNNETVLNNAKVKKEYINNTLMLINSNNQLSNIFKYVDTKASIDTTPRFYLTTLEKLGMDLRRWVKIKPLLKVKESLKSKLDIAMARVDSDIKNIEVLLDKNNTVMHDIMIMNNDLKNELNEIKETIKTINSIRSITETIRSLIKKEWKMKINSIESIKNETVNELVRFIRLEVTRLETRISESTKKELLIKAQKTNVENLDMKSKAMGSLLGVLSPSNGIIASSIISFLNNFINDINIVINEVWNYRMEIIPFKVDGNDMLDYKFPVSVDGVDNAEDISDVSSSMQEIINLGFKVVSMKYMGMGSYPLILDEYGRTMDDAHRAKAYDTIDSLTDSRFNQIFIVSHFSDSYNKLGDASITVLDPENILLNSTLNYDTDITIE